MKKILSLFLAAVILLTSLLSLFSCSFGFRVIPNADKDITGGDGEPEEIISPELKDYPDRRTVKFEEIEYNRPDIAKIVADFEAATARISDTSLSFEEKLDGIIALEDSYTNLLTMLSYSSIKKNADTTDTYWNEEYSYISENYPTFSKTLEALFVAAATSDEAERFESEYFGDGLIEKYRDGGYITEKLVELTTSETALENEYSAISTANTVITYNNATDTCDALLSKYESTYGSGSKEYSRIKNEIMALYEKERSEKSVSIYVELVKVRKSIANERGFESYVNHAYDMINHEYTEEKMLSFIDEVAEYIVPVWATLESYVFSTLDNKESTPLDRVSLINGLYRVYEKMDESLLDAYSYMLEYGLYDVNPSNENRFEGSFETYLYAFDAPYLFVSTSGNLNDYGSLSHEFGHFFDNFVNYGSDTSIDLSEVSSTALEYLTFLNLEKTLGNNARYIHFSLVREALRTFVFQSFYALFEHNVYSLADADISEQNIINAMYQAADEMGLNKDALVPDPNSGIYHALDYVLIPHLFLSPCYVESYCTSTAVSLELYFLEKSNTGAGVDVYLELIDRQGTPLLFEDYLEDVGLISPFEDGLVRDLAYKLYYDILGDYRYNENMGINTRTSVMPAA